MYFKNKFIFYYFCMAFLLYFTTLNYIANAEIIVTEIMYNPEGTDTDREWIEVYNSGTEPIDLTAYKFLENDVNHTISVFDINNDNVGGQSSTLNFISPNEYAIIADDPEMFLIDFPNTQNIFDSVFSLNNTGEDLAIISPDGVIVNSFMYSSELGANGTGNSLQLNNNGIFIPASPTPSFENNQTAANENSDQDTGDSNSSDDNSNNDNDNGSSENFGSAHSSQIQLSNYKPKNKLSVSIGRDRIVPVNTEIEFYIEHKQDKGSKIKGIWAMGDGTEKKGAKIYHTYDKEGIYNIVLNAKNDYEQSISRSKIKVFVPEIEIFTENSGKAVDIMLKNISNQEINLGNFYIKNKDTNKKFIIPKDTIIEPLQILPLNTSIKIEHTLQKVAIHYPNGEVLSENDINIQVQKIREKLSNI